MLSDIGRNADCPDVLLERLIETVEDTNQRAGRRVRLIGHSFGGVLARAAAARMPVDDIVEATRLAMEAYPDPRYPGGVEIVHPD